MSFVGLMVVDSLLPGPTADYVGGLDRENRERGMPTRDSLSDALTRALATPEHRVGVLAALVSYAAGETAARVQLPPPPPALCGQCQEPISIDQHRLPLPWCGTLQQQVLPRRR